jgi:hypothetical protein
LSVSSNIDKIYGNETKLGNELWNLIDLEMRLEVSIYPYGGLFMMHLNFSLGVLARKLIAQALKPYSLEQRWTYVSFSSCKYFINFGGKI